MKRYLRRRLLAWRARAEAGETLIEVLISAMLLGLVVIVFLGGMGTTMVTSVVHRDQADANAVLVAAMEKVRSDEVDRVPCGTDPKPAYLAAARSVPVPQPWAAKGWTAAQVIPASGMTIAHQTSPSVGTVAFSEVSCTNALPLQRITITVATPDSRVRPSLTFIKGDI